MQFLQCVGGNTIKQKNLKNEIETQNWLSMKKIFWFDQTEESQEWDWNTLRNDLDLSVTKAIKQKNPKNEIETILNLSPAP